MGVFVGTAFLTGLLGKIAHNLWLRKKPQSETKAKILAQ